MEYVKTELGYDTDFLYIGCIWKQQIDSVISSSLTVWFLSFGPKILLANQIAWFCNIKCSQNGLVFWLCSLYDRSASWLEATEIICSLIGVGILCRYPFKSRLLGSRKDCLELRRKSVLCQGIDFEQLLKLININLDIQFNYMQYNHELKHGKKIKGVSFYLRKFIKALIFRWYFPTKSHPSSRVICKLHQPSWVVGKYQRDINVLVNFSK